MQQLILRRQQQASQRMARKKNGRARSNLKSRQPSTNRTTVRGGRVGRQVSMSRIRGQRNGPTWDRLPSNVRKMAPRQITANNQTRIIHREPLATVNGSVNFDIQTFQINPGLATVFPWLSSQAAAYESYKFNSLAVEYKFTTNEFVGIGRLCIAPDYDAADDPPTSMVQAEQMTDNVMGAVAKNWTCNLRPRGIGILGPKRYTRTATLAPNLDIKTYDIAQVHVCTSGQASSDEIGQLWLVYDITLSEPQDVQEQQIHSSGSFENSTGADMLTTDLLGTPSIIEGPIVIENNLNDISISNLIPGQSYQFYFHCTAGVIATNPTITFTSGLTAVNTSEDLLTINGTNTKSYAYKCATAGQSVCTLTIGGIATLTAPTRAVFTVFAAQQY